jgi:hypothetical protein
MRSKWMLIVVVASLALNAAVVGSYLFMRLREPRPPVPPTEPPLPGLAPALLGDLRQLRQEFRPQMDALRERARALRFGLMQAAQQPQPDPRLVDSLLLEVGRVETEVNRLTFEHARRIAERLPPEAREVFFRRLAEHHAGMRPGRMMRRMGRMKPPPPGQEIDSDDINP